MIFCDQQGESAGLQATFSAQEAPLSASNWIPQSLSEPNEIGRYVEWLVAETQKHLQGGSYVKSLKRAASLSRICFMGDATNKISRLLRGSEAALRDEIAQIKTLQGRIAHLHGDAVVGQMVIHLKNRQEVRENELKSVALLGHGKKGRSFEEQAAIIVRGLVSEVKDRAFTGI